MHARTGVLIALLFIVRCSSAPSGPLGGVPPPPQAGATTSALVSTFALRSIFLGDTLRDGQRTNTAWMHFGYDLDGLQTDRQSTNVCTRATGAPISNQIDGIDGIDNAWGSALMAIIEYATGAPSPSKDATDLVASGAWTLQLEVTGLSSDPQQSAVGLGAQAFIGAPLAAPSTFDSTADWPVAPSSLSDHATLAGGAVVQFKTVYVTQGMIVAREPTAPLELPIVLLNYFYSDPKPPEPVALTLRVHHAVVTFGVDGSNGTIAGTLDAEETLAAALDFARHVNQSTCAGFAWVLDEVRQAQDILANGTNVAGVPCDAISIGLGFDAQLIANATRVGTDPVPTPDLCGDAGLD